ncbi:DUF3107 domain-containing protein [Ornithinimicrobium faecis]|uniref:DUF3107 domain-containing protein n=1 Tax=Ornithinimicrobium faecis TaxID=2934158 RepID=A0ABY4YWC7_9MICO|nr:MULTISPECIES: DUF3107 domain-containing protein [unclassified Ornithinimicrobium]USQ81040.1 DUF3107 domain-containing protein [Ornithinimicrobium sp. HY1793]
MEVRIGVKHVSREVVIESAQKAEEVQEIVTSALGGEGTLDLTDDKGRRVLIPVDSVAYVEIGVEEAGKVGFGSY